ncbi:MAG: nitrophenyl compound nitroreductase subunit ArsF family protein [bacterium]|nr:nitrophenyl compound nitroreductase subunit ArsF family protein [bacterium]
MAIKKILTGFLIAFVVLSIGMAFQKHMQSSVPALNGSGENANELTAADGSTGDINTSVATQPETNTEPINPEEGEVPVVLAADNLQQHRLIVYYFHRTMRCTGCINVEEGSYQAVSIDHEEDIASGFLEWQSINFEEPEYERFVTEYNLYSQELILLEVRDGVTIRHAAIAEIWQHYDDKTKIRQMVDELIEEWLREIKES